MGRYFIYAGAFHDDNGALVDPTGPGAYWVGAHTESGSISNGALAAPVKLAGITGLWGNAVDVSVSPFSSSYRCAFIYLYGTVPTAKAVGKVIPVPVYDTGEQTTAGLLTYINQVLLSVGSISPVGDRSLQEKLGEFIAEFEDPETLEMRRVTVAETLGEPTSLVDSLIARLGLPGEGSTIDADILALGSPAQAGDAMTLTEAYDAAKTAAQAGDAMALTAAYDAAKAAASQASVDDLDTTLAAIQLLLEAIGSGDVTVVAPVLESGDVALVQGDDYNADDGRELRWTFDGAPDLTTLDAMNLVLHDDEYPMVVVDEDDATLELTSDETGAIHTGTHDFAIVATAGGSGVERRLTIATGQMTVTAPGEDES